MPDSNVVIKVLGTAQDGGVPQPNCTCEHCLLTYKSPKLKRYATSLAVVFPDQKKWHLIDATPDIREQMRMMKERYPGMGLMDSILLTHAHIGHYTGLMFLGKEAISSNELPVYAGEQMRKFLHEHAPWQQLVLLKNIDVRTILNDVPFKLDKAKITPLEVPHRNEYSETFGFIISGQHKSMLYISDIDRWEQWDRNVAEVASSVDFCLLDATFYSKEEITAMGRDFQQIPHPLLADTMDKLQKIVNAGETNVYFTHFNHTNPVVDPGNEVRKTIHSRGFHIAEEGMELRL